MSKKPHKRGLPTQSKAVPMQLLKELDLAEKAYEQRRWPEAAVTLKKVVARYPSSIDGWAMLGNVYSQMNDTTGVWQAAITLLKLAPQEPEHWYNAVVASIQNNLPFSAQHYTN